VPPRWGFVFFNSYPAVSTAGYFMPSLRNLKIIYHRFNFAPQVQYIIAQRHRPGFPASHSQNTLKEQHNHPLFILPLQGELDWGGIYPACRCAWAGLWYSGLSGRNIFKTQFLCISILTFLAVCLKSRWEFTL
jgi:hypothetical protein